MVHRSLGVALLVGSILLASTVARADQEICNGIDDDGDGLVDDADDSVVGQTRYYLDSDRDRHGAAGTFIDRCLKPVGYVRSSNDCDDADDAVGGPVNLFVDTDRDGFGKGHPSHGCPRPGYAPKLGDCAPDNPDIFPGADEVCDRRDNDCNGWADDEDRRLVGPDWYRDTDGDGYGDDADTVPSCNGVEGYVPVGGDCDAADPLVHPEAPEFCDDTDNDCDGRVDEHVVAGDWYVDADGDGFGDSSQSVHECGPPDGYVYDATDCDDGDGAIHPEAFDDCGDDVDGDCNGVEDDCRLDVSDADGVVRTIATANFFNRNEWMSPLTTADVDADGVDDLIIGTPWLAEYGGVTAWLGPIDEVPAGEVTYMQPFSHEPFGETVAGGDANGDGADDLLVGARGQVLLFLGPSHGERSWDDADAIYFAASLEDDQLGAFAHLGPDVDGDELADVVFTSPFGGPEGDGLVFVARAQVSRRSVELYRRATYEFWGRDGMYGDALPIDDIDGDGINELALETNGADELDVEIVPGGLAPGSYDAADASVCTLFGMPHSTFGGRLASDDMDGDGYGDLIVGDKTARDDAGVSSGAVYLFLGPLSGAAAPTEAATVWTGGESAISGLGTAFAVGDVDADALPDLVMGVPHFDDERGVVYVQLGPASGNVALPSLPSIAETRPESLGLAVATIPDWTGDGGAEVAIQAIHNSRNNYYRVTSTTYIFDSEWFH